MGALGWGTDHDLRFCLLTAAGLYSCRFNEGKDTEIFSNVTWEAGGWRTRGPQMWNHHVSRILVCGLCNVSKVLCLTSSSMIFIPDWFTELNGKEECFREKRQFSQPASRSPPGQVCKHLFYHFGSLFESIVTPRGHFGRP